MKCMVQPVVKNVKKKREDKSQECLQLLSFFRFTRNGYIGKKKPPHSIEIKLCIRDVQSKQGLHIRLSRTESIELHQLMLVGIKGLLEFLLFMDYDSDIIVIPHIDLC